MSNISTATATTSYLSYLNPFNYGNNLFYLFTVLKFASTLYLFHKALLPVVVARYFGRVFHFATFPLVIVFQFSGLRGNLIDKISEHVYLGAAPYFWDFHLLRTNNIQATVNLCDEYGGPTYWYSKNNITQLYIPVVDHYEPGLAEIKTAVKFIEENAQLGNNVFIHCKAGRGRSGAVAICWVAYHYQMTLEQAQQYLLERRSKVRKSLYKQKNVMAFYSKYCINRSPLY